MKRARDTDGDDAFASFAKMPTPQAPGPRPGGRTFDGEEWFVNRLPGEVSHIHVKCSGRKEPRTLLDSAAIIRQNPDFVPGTVSIDELVGDPATIRGALLTTMCFDPEYMCQVFGKVRDVTFIYHVDQPREISPGVKTEATTPDVLARYRCFPPTWRLVGHELKGGCFHCKLMILRRDRSLRIVIASSNLNTQWIHDREVCWVQDFDVLGAGEEWDPEDEGDFRKDLGNFCHAIRAGDVFDRLTARVDLSPAKCMLVASVPGLHSAKKFQKGQAGIWHPDTVGHLRLRQVGGAV
jgi:hypothetical protein